MDNWLAHMIRALRGVSPKPPEIDGFFENGKIARCLEAGSKRSGYLLDG
jgi:hypothetical protein